MKHFLRISYNVFYFHFRLMAISLAVNVVLGMILSYLLKDSFMVLWCCMGSIFTSIGSGYIDEYKRFKDKGHY